MKRDYQQDEVKSKLLITGDKYKSIYNGATQVNTWIALGTPEPPKVYNFLNLNDLITTEVPYETYIKDVLRSEL